MVATATLVAVGGFKFYKLAHSSRQQSQREVIDELLGEKRHSVHRLIAWESENYGFDDGYALLEFVTDEAGFQEILTVRQFAETSGGLDNRFKSWAKNPGDWPEGFGVFQYEDASEFDDHGTIYFLLRRGNDPEINVILVRTQQ